MKLKQEKYKKILFLWLSLLFSLGTEAVQPPLILRNLKENTHHQTEIINDCFTWFGDDYGTYNELFRIPYICIRAFVNSLDSDLVSHLDVLVFQEGSGLKWRKEAVMEKGDSFRKNLFNKMYPFNLYDYNKHINWWELLNCNTLLIQYGVSLGGSRILVYLNAAVLSDDKKGFWQQRMLYIFQYSFVEYKCENKKFQKSLNQFIENVENNTSYWINDKGELFKGFDDNQLSWRLTGIECPDAELKDFDAEKLNATDVFEQHLY